MSNQGYSTIYCPYCVRISRLRHGVMGAHTEETPGIGIVL